MPVHRKFSFQYSRYFITRFSIICLLSCFSLAVHAQDTVAGGSALVPVKDVGDILKQLFNKKADTTKVKKPKTVAILPSIGYNPSFGFVIGAKISAVKNFGKDENTNLSSFGLEGIYTSKGIITAQARHNAFTENNKWNFQGNWQLSKFLITDYGIGTGNKDVLTDGDSAFLIRFTFIRLTEKLYRSIGKNLYAGAGISFDIRAKIKDEQLDAMPSSPHYRYSLRNGFDPKKYSANGLLLAIQYNSREHPLRSYGGLYADLSLRLNQQWLGSTKNAFQVMYDIRKYVGLSNKNPEHVLAFWHWASYKLSGDVPYLEMPATAYDTYGRSGRAFTMGRFKGPSYACFEAEWRFPITRNKLISGVAFTNLQTASDDLGKKVFHYWESAGGGGLRILFQKQSRSTICIDYARGKYDSGAFFFGLNEVF
ncbi:MAG TPA: BamA/TamA family outer membrane protein [Chitinophagaceae bacterium]